MIPDTIVYYVQHHDHIPALDYVAWSLEDIERQHHENDNDRSCYTETPLLKVTLNLEEIDKDQFLLNLLMGTRWDPDDAKLNSERHMWESVGEGDFWKTEAVV